MSTHNVTLRRVEKASLDAWPALSHAFYCGWVLRYAHGYTKRANSVNSLYPSDESEETLVDKIAYCEAFYNAHCEPTTFRLTPLAPERLDRVLHRLGYQRKEPTRVLIRSLAEPLTSISTPLPPTVLIHAETPDAWLESWCHCQRAATAQAGAYAVHRAILNAIQGERLLGVLRIDGEPVACGLGVVGGGMLGLFDFITHPEHRGKGYATALLETLFSWVARKGLSMAYLQVTTTNSQAIALYQSLGFRDLYRYWYRIKALEPV